MMIAPASIRFFVSVASYGGTRLLERERAARGPHERRVDVVLQRDRDPVQRSADPSLRALAIALVSELECLRIDRDRRVQLVLVGADAHQVLAHDAFDVVRPCSSARRMSGIVVSTTVNGLEEAGLRVWAVMLIAVATAARARTSAAFFMERDYNARLMAMTATSPASRRWRPNDLTHPDRETALFEHASHHASVVDADAVPSHAIGAARAPCVESSSCDGSEPPAFRRTSPSLPSPSSCPRSSSCRRFADGRTR